MDTTLKVAEIGVFLEGAEATPDKIDFWKRLLAALLENKVRLKIYGFEAGKDSILTLAGFTSFVEDVGCAGSMSPPERARWVVLHPGDDFLRILLESEGRRAAELHPYVLSMLQSMSEAA